MIYAEMKMPDGETYRRFYTTWEEYIKDTFCPDIEILAVVEWKTKKARRRK